MDFEETQRLGILGFDEKTETWYVQPRDSQRVMLTRRSLARLVHLYNGIHTGSSLVLIEQRELEKIERTRQQQSEALRDLYLYLDRRQRRRPTALLRRLAQALARAFR